MARYIDADNFRKTMIKRFGCIPCLTDYSEASRYDIPVDDALDLVPTADVVPSSEVEKLELTLQGVMWSVDKWLDETDYDADPIKRAITMREKTLKIVENLKAEVAREIFAEIEEVFRQHTEGGYYLNGTWFPERFDLYTGDAIAELKKKYTGGELWAKSQ